MRFCLILIAVPIALWGANASSGTKSTVRSDSRSGRLVRTFVAPEGAVRRTPAALKTMIEQTSKQHDVDPLLVESMIQVESNYNENAISPKGAQGLMQLIPATARRFGVSDVFDAQQNLEGGIKYLKYLQGLYSDNRLALAAYNAGEGAVAKYSSIPPYAETQNYVKNVGQRYSKAQSEQAKQNPVAEVPAAPRIQEFVDSEGRIHYRMQ